ncbi:MAG TPA: HisA/HisF-related TIM barrel protein [Gemmatimonadales bacterium]|nr:HisA/HisF-related TIM barrel protein [Gemmatimonadales bacterium]
MEIIPVLDLAHGVAMHARGGVRSAYQPVRSALLDTARDAPGDARALARAYWRSLGTAACYAADLDAIQGKPIQRSLLHDLAADLAVDGAGGELLVDAGVSTAAGARQVLACGVTAVVVGLETLRSFAELAAIVQAVGTSRVVLSLDLRDGAPILHPALRRDAADSKPPVELAGHAVELGVGTVLILDLARVGAGCGVDLALLDQVRRRCPRTRLLAGGGVRTRNDLERMAGAGCDGALVASALHTGRIGAADVAALRGRRAAVQSAASTSR